MTRVHAPLVVHVTSYYPPFLGGLEKVVESLATDRSRRGLPVKVLTSRHGQQFGVEAAFVRRFSSWQFANTAIIPGLLRALFKLPRTSVIHLHIALAFVPEVVYIAHLFRRIPYVAHLHLDVGPSGWAGFLLRAYKPLVLGPVLRRAGAVVVLTDSQRLHVVRKYGVRPDKVSVIPNAVDEEFVFYGERFLSEKPRLLFVGRLSAQKNVMLLLKALNSVSDRFETILVGDGEQASELREAVRVLRLQNVRFYGRAQGTELRELYRNSDLFVLPSEREGLPLVLLEAMAMGLPIVATDVPGNRDVVVHEKNGLLVPPGDPVAFRSALFRAIGDADNYRHMSEECRRMASKYSRSTAATDFERIYQRLCKC